MSSEERAKILQLLADGKVSAEQAAQLLTALDGAEPAEANSATFDDQPATRGDSPPAFPALHLGGLWLIPMYVGLALFVCGALAVFPLYADSGSWLLVACGWPVFVIGLLTMIAAWLSRKSRWIHVRITNVDDSQRSIKFSFPIPLRLTAWVLRIGSRFAPRLKDSGVDEMIVALSEEITSDQPLIVDVQEGDDGERVQVYIG